MRFIADTHCHTIASQHAYSTIDENMLEAAQKGLIALAITDHAPAMDDGANWGHFVNMQILPDVIHGVHLLRGAELNILDYNGNVDLEPWILEQMDLVIASMHGGLMPEGTEEQITQAYVNIAKNPLVHIVGHCGTEMYRFDYEKGVKAFKEYGKIVEINEGSTRVRKTSYKNCAEIAKLCKKYELEIVVSGDSHYCNTIGDFPKSVQMLEEIGFPERLILNADEDRFRQAMQTYCGVTMAV